MPEDDELQRRLRKLEVGHAETRWLTLRVDDDVKEIRDELRAVRATQQEHTDRFDSIDARLRDQGAQLRDQGAQLRDQGAQLRDQGAQLRDHSSRFDSIDAQLQDHSAQLQEHNSRFDSVDAQLRSLTQLVGQVLDRLPERDG